MKVNERSPDHTVLWVATVLAAFMAVVLVISVLALFGTPTKASLTRTKAPVLVATTVTVADLAPLPLAVDSSTTARPGEGVIRITTRVCGNADNWQVVAAANGISATSNPPYLVLLGQRIVVACTGTSQAQTAPAPAQASGWTKPVSACISSGFGMRWGAMHWGTDLSANYGVAIRAAAAGTVSTGYQGGGAGNYTMINHGGGVWTVYMHQSRFAVTSGWVNTGTVIGYVGSTGNSTGAHLHLEVHTGGLWNGRVNPVGFFSDRGIRLGC